MSSMVPVWFIFDYNSPCSQDWLWYFWVSALFLCFPKWNTMVSSRAMAHSPCFRDGPWSTRCIWQMLLIRWTSNSWFDKIWSGSLSSLTKKWSISDWLSDTSRKVCQATPQFGALGASYIESGTWRGGFLAKKGLPTKDLGLVKLQGTNTVEVPTILWSYSRFVVFSFRWNLNHQVKRSNAANCKRLFFFAESFVSRLARLLPKHPIPQVHFLCECCCEVVNFTDDKARWGKDQTNKTHSIDFDGNSIRIERVNNFVELGSAPCAFSMLRDRRSPSDNVRPLGPESCRKTKVFKSSHGFAKEENILELLWQVIGGTRLIGSVGWTRWNSKTRTNCNIAPQRTSEELGTGTKEFLQGVLQVEPS